MKKSLFFWICLMSVLPVLAQTAAYPKKKLKQAQQSEMSVKPMPQNQKLPLDVFLKIVDSSEEFVINHATEFQHIDLPKRHFDTFNRYIIDSVATEVPGLKSLIYYYYVMKDGSIIIGDIYWNEQTSYIVFKIYDKKYVNYFSRDGVLQLRSLFKL